MSSSNEQVVSSLAKAPGEFHRVSLSQGSLTPPLPVFRQRLDKARYEITIRPGSDAYRVLSNDQNRFALPRSLPPLIALWLPEDPEGSPDHFTIFRHPYTEGAFELLEDLLERGYVFSLGSFLHFLTNFAQSLDFLHRHGVIHGQWNARSVIVLEPESTNDRDGAQDVFFGSQESSPHRHVLINTGIVERRTPRNPENKNENKNENNAESRDEPPLAPEEGLATDGPADVLAFATFMEKVRLRAGSRDELPAQASSWLDALRLRALQRGWPSTEESIRSKELEILDHLYTIKVRTDAILREGTAPREERASAQRLHQMAEDLLSSTTSYVNHLLQHGFEPFNAFSEKLLHYTAFDVSIDPGSLDNMGNRQFEIRGKGFPTDWTQVSLNECEEPLTVLEATPDRLLVEVPVGLPKGTYRISLDNRRTNGEIVVQSPTFEGLTPDAVHRPWSGFDFLAITLRGRGLPDNVPYSLTPRLVETDRADSSAGTRALECEIPLEAEPVEARRTPLEDDERRIRLKIPQSAMEGVYDLRAHGVSTGLTVTIREPLPEPDLSEGVVEPSRVLNHQDRELVLHGRNLHPDMLLELRDRITAEMPEGFCFAVDDAHRATLRLAADFTPGTYRLSVNGHPTEVTLNVVRPSWLSVEPARVRVHRGKPESPTFTIRGTDLPSPSRELYRIGDVTPTIRSQGTEEGATEHQFELEPESLRKLARGHHGIVYGEHDTGLSLKVERQRSLAAKVSIATCLASVVILLGAFGFMITRPEVQNIRPSLIYAFVAPIFEVEGRRLERLTLLDERGREHPLSLVEADAANRWASAPLQPGSYRLIAHSSLGIRIEHPRLLEVRPPSFSANPSELDRATSTRFQLATFEGISLDAYDALELYPIQGSSSSPHHRATLDEGTAQLELDTWTPSLDGIYGLSLGGVALSDSSGEALTITIRGPEVAAIVPNPVFIDADGFIRFTVQGRGMPLDASLMLRPADMNASEDPIAAQVVPAPPRPTSKHINWEAESLRPGTYALSWHQDGVLKDEPLGLRLDVLNTPTIGLVRPDRRSPGSIEPLRVIGFLKGLETIVLSPTDPGPPIELPVDRAERIPRDDGLDELVFEGLELESGSYVLEPSDGVHLEVRDTCEELITAFTQGKCSAKDVLNCVKAHGGDPSLRLFAADRLFDHGAFSEARELYSQDPSLRSLFRTHFVSTYIQGGALPRFELKEEGLQDVYGVALTRMGWTQRPSHPFPADIELSWELELVRATSAQDPDIAIASFDRVREMVPSESNGAFDFVDRRFAQALFLSVRHHLSRALIAKAESLLDRRLFGDPLMWDALSEAQRGQCHFWKGHLLLWYGGDESQAREFFRRGASLESSQSSKLCADYLAALDLDDAALASSLSTRTWTSRFLQVFLAFRTIRRGPNYNLLSEQRHGNAYLAPREREFSAILHRHMESLEQSEHPEDPLAHYALLFYLRQSQAHSWPRQKGGLMAEKHRERLDDLDLDSRAQSMRSFYIALGSLDALAPSQLHVLSDEDVSRQSERIASLLRGGLPDPLHERALAMQQKLSARGEPQ